jgi:hypothetical protein
VDTELTKSVVRQVVDDWNRGDLDALDEHLAPELEYAGVLHRVLAATARSRRRRRDAPGDRVDVVEVDLHEPGADPVAGHAAVGDPSPHGADADVGVFGRGGDAHEPARRRSHIAMSPFFWPFLRAPGSAWLHVMCAKNGASNRRCDSVGPGVTRCDSG